TINIPEYGMRQAPLKMATSVLTSDRVATKLSVDYPEHEVRAFARAVIAEREGKRDDAALEYRKVLATPGKGDIHMLASHHLARVLRASGDVAGAAKACEDVLAPRAYQGY